MKLHDLRPADGARRERKRVGRGIGSGSGKTSGRGHKGQGSRSGGGVRQGFEGGQMPLQRRLPIRGFNNERYKTYFALVQVQDLAVFPADSVVDLDALQDAGLVNNPRDGVKVLGTGSIDKALTVRVAAFSKSAEDKITAAGGKAEVI